MTVAASRDGVLMERVGLAAEESCDGRHPADTDTIGVAPATR